ncbi:MAG: efflux RND transporter periplasmic adaptor subunit [Zhongshania sp.]|uniref:efflux RND transporter periplasmic adaptor subunit n=1 Tax=Zhongshania sp. TaxID=1971902 RepID=UPI00261A00BB|nr:efflux RND transporter periplasmic adaptor subunit [Zhongshania sp.]MDF1694011.1 efflux RND transporter periplasmic adaptor subunit [Zhongshania sp.]
MVLGVQFSRAVLKPIVLVLMSILALSACDDAPPVAPTSAAVAVNVQRMEAHAVAIGGQYPGRAMGSKEVQIRARVEGILLRRTYTEGQTVKAGQLLFQIDAAPFQVALNRSKAQLAQANAGLASAARRWERAGELIKTNAISRRERDDAESDLDFAKAAVQLAKAEVEAAQINLDYTQVRAPIAGITSREQLSEGSLVGPTNSLLTEITQLDPILVNVSLPDKLVLNIRRMVSSGEIEFKDGKREVEIVLGPDDTYPHLAQVDFTESAIDKLTGTVQLRATVPNPDGLILPGQFLRVRLHGLVSLNSMVVPARAIMQSAQGIYVFRVDNDNHAEMVNVTLGLESEEGVIIESGLKVGDLVIVDGVSRVQAGTLLAPTEVSTIPAAKDTVAEGVSQ